MNNITSNKRAINRNHDLDTGSMVCLKKNALGHSWKLQRMRDYGFKTNEFNTKAPNTRKLTRIDTCYKSKALN